MVWHPRCQYDGPSPPLLSLEQQHCGQTGREPQTGPQLPPCSSSSFCGGPRGCAEHQLCQGGTGKWGGALEEEGGTAGDAWEAGPPGGAERQHPSRWTVISGAVARAGTLLSDKAHSFLDMEHD